MSSRSYSADVVVNSPETEQRRLRSASRLPVAGLVLIVAALLPSLTSGLRLWLAVLGLGGAAAGLVRLIVRIGKLRRRRSLAEFGIAVTCIVGAVVMVVWAAISTADRTTVWYLLISAVWFGLLGLCLLGSGTVALRREHRRITDPPPPPAPGEPDYGPPGEVLTATEASQVRLAAGATLAVVAVAVVISVVG